jgi:PAS domain S-box-containing protein
VTLAGAELSSVTDRLPRIVLIGLSSLTLTALVILVSVSLWQTRTQAIAEAIRTTENLARTLEEHAFGSVYEADIVLANFAERFEEQARRGPLDLEQVHQALSAGKKLGREFRNFAVIDAAGNRIASASGDPRPLNLLDRDYLTVLRDHPEIEFYISKPFLSRIANVWSLGFSRRLHQPDGSFGGVVFAALDLGRLQSFYAELDVGQHGHVTLWDGSASHVLARYPADNSMLSQTFEGGPLFASVAAGQRVGTFQSVSPLDGVERIVSFRRVGDLPLVVSVGFATSEVLADWYRDLWSYGIGTAIGSAVIMLLTGVLLRQLRRQQAFVAALRAGELATAEANQRLQASEERFRDYAEMASDWYWETDSEHRFTYVSNPIRAFGIDPRKLVGKRRIDGAIDGGDEEKWRAHLACLERHEPFSDFVYRYSANGEARYSSPSGKPLFAADGKFLGYRGSARDVTDVIRTEERLREALAVAETANRTKSEFLASMSHELRTPLNAILGFSDLIRSGMCGADGDKAREYAGDIHLSGQHLLNMINDILEISRIEAGAVKLREGPVDLAEAIAVCVRLIAPRASEGKLALKIEIRDRLPMIFIDDTRLKQILLNLLSNAAKFTPPGGTVTVRAAMAEDGSMVISVIDNGIGMTPAELDIAMQPFRQVDSILARRSEGTGLGLPLTKAFVELHGGQLAIDSAPGLGTTARVTLPSDRVLRMAA